MRVQGGAGLKGWGGVGLWLRLGLGLVRVNHVVYHGMG